MTPPHSRGERKREREREREGGGGGGGRRDVDLIQAYTPGGWRIRERGGGGGERRKEGREERANLIQAYTPGRTRLWESISLNEVAVAMCSRVVLFCDCCVV